MRTAAVVMGAAIAMLFAGAPVAGAAPSTKYYTSTAAPTTLSLGTSNTVTFTLANDPGSSQAFGSAQVTLGGFPLSQVSGVSVTASDGSSGWSTQLSSSGGSAVVLVTSPSNTHGVVPGSDLFMTAELTPTSVGTIPVTTQVKQSNNFSGPNNQFALIGSDPTLQVQYQLAFVAQPPPVLTISTVAPATAFTYTCPTVQVEDLNGNPVAAAGIPVTLSYGAAGNPGLYYGSTPVPSSGVVAYTDANGLATFGTSGCTTGLAATEPGSGYTLSATGPGAAGPASSSGFQVGYQLLFSQEPPAVVQVSGPSAAYAMTPAPTVQLADGLGNPVAVPGIPITLGYAAAYGNPGLSVCAPTVSTDNNGQAVFGADSSGCPGVTATIAGDGYELSGSTTAPGSLTPVTSSPFDVGFQLAFSTEPPAAVQQSVPPKSFSYMSSGGQPVTVQVEDSSGQPIAAPGVAVTLASDPAFGTAAGPGLYYAGAPVGSGGVTVTTGSSGQAAFTTLAATNLGSGFELLASASGTSTDSTPYSVAQSVTNCPATGTCTSATVTSAQQGTKGFVTSTSTGGSAYDLSLSFGEGLQLNCGSQVMSGPLDPLVISSDGQASGYLTLDFTKAEMNSVVNNGASQMPVCSGATQTFYGASYVSSPTPSNNPYVYQGLLADCTDPGYLADNSALKMCVFSRSRLPGGGEQVVIYQSSLNDPMHI